MTKTFSLGSGGSVGLGSVLARAGEGSVFEVAGRADLVAKVFHPGLADLAGKGAKVAAMAASPPPGAVQRDGFVVLTWPQDVLLDDSGAVAGYVMARIDTTDAVEIHTVSNPSNRNNPLASAPQWTPHATWMHLLTVAANLCLAVEVVHRVDAVIGDFQERNILVCDTSRVSLVDCDSMQFTDPTGHQYLCAVGRPEFTAPELAGVDLATTPREKPSDLFALAVHIHQLLMGGNHPFLRGIWIGAGEQPDALSLARTGSWAGGAGSPLNTHPLAPPPTFLPDTLQRLFNRAFTDGARDPAARPSAAEWRTSLIAVRVSTCARGHQVPVETYPCPWCVIEDNRSNRRNQQSPYPDEQTIHPATPPKVTDPTISAAHPKSTSRPGQPTHRRLLLVAIAIAITAFASTMAMTYTSLPYGLLSLMLLIHLSCAPIIGAILSLPAQHKLNGKRIAAAVPGATFGWWLGAHITQPTESINSEFLFRVLQVSSPLLCAIAFGSMATLFLPNLGGLQGRPRELRKLILTAVIIISINFLIPFLTTTL